MLSTQAIPHANQTHPKYQYLGEHVIDGDKTVVLFIRQNTGTVIHGEGVCRHSIGDYSDRWVESNFDICRDKITLVNQ